MADIESTGPGLGHREISFTRTDQGRYAARNARGGELAFGSGDDTDFTPVELLLVAIAGCSAVDVDLITGKRADPTRFEVTATGTKVRDEQGNRLQDITISFTVEFPEGEAGDRAREMLPRAIEMSHDRLCTVSRTVQIGTPVTMRDTSPGVG
ncbi:OsmC-like protein [Nostocoides australiense Ben110]|uniref:OsmC-like protein n=1 Tax=Nostocoides australiense Ben110 TaxID=1193182 RepID=W6JRZ8_9MICO|nr:OsmC family protein [Tetrasphaera australiensis]CCH71608.1 OsmC-like protein [Tetrasphaera australiensis Ben110]